MPFSHWNIGFSGNWNNAFNWSSGSVPDASNDVAIAAAGTYTITLASNVTVDSITLDAAGATLDATGSIVFAASSTALAVEAGTAILDGDNTIATSVTQTGGLIEAGNEFALGQGTYALAGGEFLGTATETIANTLSLYGDVTLAATHGTTLAVGGSAAWTIQRNGGMTLTFGDGSNDGTVVWNTPVNSLLAGTGTFDVNVASGTLKAGIGSLGTILQNATNTSIAAGATLDQAGQNLEIGTLAGAGTITDSGGAATLNLITASFSGSIQSSLALDVHGTTTLTGASTYTGGTTIETGAQLQLGNGGTTGTVTGDILDNGTLVYDHSNNFTQTVGITGSGDVIYQGGDTVTIGRTETYSGLTTLNGVTIVATSSNPLGPGQLTIDNSKLIATANVTLSNAETILEGNDTVAAAHGATLTIDQSTLNFYASTAPLNLVIGQIGDDGTVVLGASATGTEATDFAINVDVAAGTLQPGNDSGLGSILQYANVTVETGAIFNLNGRSDVFIGNLLGTGAVTNSGGAVTNITSGNFAGVISGATEVAVQGGLILTGTNTFSLGIAIDSGAALSLGNGGTTGSVLGDITDDGTLYIDRSNTFTAPGTISGSGSLTQLGTGTTVIDIVDSYTGGTNVAGGILSISQAGAIGTGGLSLQGGEFLTTATIAPTNALSLSGHSTIAAATGTTLTLNGTQTWSLDATGGASVTFGDSTHAGTVVWDTPATPTITDNSYAVVVNDGTLKAGDGSLFMLLQNGQSTTVGAGGTIDLAGFATGIIDLLGSGRIVNSGAGPDYLTLIGGDFSGQIDGAIAVQIEGTATLSGASTFSGGIELDMGAALNFAGGAFTHAVTFDGSGVLNVTNAAGATETFIVTSSATGIDTMEGGAGTEIFALPTLTAVDHINGGTGTAIDEIKLSAVGTIAASALANVSHIEELVLANGTNNITLTTGIVSSADDNSRLTIMGGAGNDTIDASAAVAGASVVFYASSGNDSFTGGTDADYLEITPANLTSADTYNGGTGSAIDEIVFNAAGTLAASAFANVSHVEELVLANGTNSVTLTDALVSSSDHNHSLAIIGAAGADTIDASAVTTATDAVVFTGNGGADSFTGGLDADTFKVAATDLTSADIFNGGTGTALDQIDFTTAGSIAAAAFTNVSHIEELVLANGTNSVILTNAMVNSADDNHRLTVMGGTGNDTVNAGADAAGQSVVFYASSGNDSFTGGTDADYLEITPANLTSADTFNGGTGTAIDEIVFNAAGTVAASAFTNVSHVEELVLANGTNSVTLTNALVTSADDGHKLTVVGGTGADTINAAAVTTTTDAVSFHGGAGADVMTASAGTDTFVYAAASDSSSTGYDTISAINFGVDRFDIPGAAGTITGIDTAITTGALSTASFDANLTSDLAGHLAAHHAELFTASSGTLAGQEFLVIDLNGTAGYQAGQDIVIHLTGATGTLVPGDFV